MSIFDMSVKKVVTLAVIGLVSLFLALNSYTYVPVGYEKVEVCLGQVTGKQLSNGVHLVKPHCSYDEMNTQNQILEFDRILLPTQDRMESFGDVVVKFRILPDGLTSIRQEYGSEEAFLRKTLNRDIPDAVKAAARQLKDSAHLADNSFVDELKQDTVKVLREKLGNTVEIQEVLLLDVEYDKKVVTQIQNTKDRQEQEKQQLSKLAIKQTELQEQVAAAEASAQSAMFEAQQRQAIADAKLYEAEKEALAIRVKGEAIAQNPGLIKYMETEALVIEANRWDGNRTLTHNIVATPLTNVTK